MKIDPTFALLAAGGALVGYGLYRVLSRGDEAAPASAAPMPVQPDAGADAAITYGEPKAYSPFPAGYRRTKSSEVTPELSAKASSIRNASGFTSMSYGTVIPIVGADAALIEQHYHEPGGAVKPWGYHHGVTLIRKA